MTTLWTDVTARWRIVNRKLGMAIEAPSTSEARGILEDFRNRDERFKGRRVQHWVPQVPLEWLETAEPYRVYWTDAVPTEYVDGPLLFVVSVPEVWRQERIVRAQNPEAAREEENLNRA